MRQILLIVLAGCAPKHEVPEETDLGTTFPDGLAPVEPNTAPFPTGDAAYPEQISLVTREDDQGTWTHAAGYFQASLADVWAVIQNPDVCADRRHITSYTVTVDEPPKFDVGFQVHNVVEDIVTIAFTNQWDQGLVEGSSDVPELVAVRFGKSAGSPFVTTLEGSAVLRRVEAGITSIEVVEHLDAVRTGPDDTEGFIQDFYDSARIMVHGGALPVYDPE